MTRTIITAISNRSNLELFVIQITKHDGDTAINLFFFSRPSFYFLFLNSLSSRVWFKVLSKSVAFTGCSYFFSCAQFRVLEYAIRVFFSPRIKMVIISLFGIVCVTQTSRHFYESHSLVWVWAHSSVICGWLCLIYTVSVNLDLHQNLVCLLHWKLFYPQWGVEMWLNGAKHWPLKYLANPHRLAKHKCLTAVLHSIPGFFYYYYFNENNNNYDYY